VPALLRLMRDIDLAEDIDLEELADAVALGRRAVVFVAGRAAHLRREVLLAIEKIDPAAASSARDGRKSPVLELAAPGETPTRAAAVPAQLGKKAGKETLIAVLRREHSPNVLVDCLNALASLGEESKSALSFVLPLRHHPSARVRTAAAGLIWKLTRDGRSVLDVLRSVAANSRVRSSVRVDALRTLAAMGKEAKSVFLELALIELDPSAPDEVRRQARVTVVAVRREARLAPD
jgi:hypothetical protein